MTGISADANETLVQLRELEREAESYKDLYQKFLQRYQESLQQESFPVTEARIISPAAVPQETSGPKKSLVLALCAMLGLAFGTGLGALQEYRDRFFRTGCSMAAGCTTAGASRSHSAMMSISARSTSPGCTL